MKNVIKYEIYNVESYVTQRDLMDNTNISRRISDKMTTVQKTFPEPLTPHRCHIILGKTN